MGNHYRWQIFNQNYFLIDISRLRLTPIVHLFSMPINSQNNLPQNIDNFRINKRLPCLFIFRLAFVEKTRQSDDEMKRRRGDREREKCRKRNYHKLNAIKWIYILFAYITERADTSSCSLLNEKEMRACYVHGARKRKKKGTLKMVANEIKLEFEYKYMYAFSSYFITSQSICHTKYLFDDKIKHLLYPMIVIVVSDGIIEMCSFLFFL
jgi:hypothetical protein